MLLCRQLTLHRCVIMLHSHAKFIRLPQLTEVDLHELEKTRLLCLVDMAVVLARGAAEKKEC